MLSIIAFIGGAAIGGFAVGIPAVLEIRRINSRGWEWYHIAENAVSELNRSEEHTSELQSLMRISYAVFCLKKKKTKQNTQIVSMRKQNQNKNINTIQHSYEY